MNNVVFIVTHKGCLIIARPSKYSPPLLPNLEMLYILGATDIEVCQATGITEPTLHKWKKDNPELIKSIKESKAIPDNNVKQSLYRRACGYSHIETKVFVIDGKIVEHNVTKHYPPDTAAAFIWLKNRCPQEWRDRIEVEHHHTIEDGVNQKRIEMESTGLVPGSDHDYLDIHCQCNYCRVKRGEVVKQIAEVIE